MTAQYSEMRSTTLSGSIVKVTRKGQITIPVEIRERLGIKGGDRVVVTMGTDDTAQLTPATSPTDSLFGSLHELAGLIPIDAHEMHRAALQARRDEGDRGALD